MGRHQCQMFTRRTWVYISVFLCFAATWAVLLFCNLTGVNVLLYRRRVALQYIETWSTSESGWSHVNMCINVFRADVNWCRVWQIGAKIQLKTDVVARPLHAAHGQQALWNYPRLLVCFHVSFFLLYEHGAMAHAAWDLYVTADSSTWHAVCNFCMICLWKAIYPVMTSPDHVNATEWQRKVLGAQRS